MRLPLVLMLVWLVAAWSENEAGDAERALFERTVRRNARFGTDECAARFGVPFWDALRASKRPVCESVVAWDHLGFGAVLLTNVSLTASETLRTEWETPFRDADLDVAAVCNDTNAFTTAMHSLGSHVREVRGVVGQIYTECDEWVDSPFVVLPWFDSTNWWHFVEQALFPAFLYVGVAQRELLASGRDVRMGTLRWPANEVYNVRTQGVYPRWVALPELLDRLIGPLHVFPNEDLRHTCFRSVLWVRQYPTHLAIEQLASHATTDCFSPIARAMADHVRASVGVVWPPVSSYHERIRVVYASRDPNNTWTLHQRARNWDQSQIIAQLAAHVRGYGCTFEELRFYYTNMKTAREQVLRVGVAHVLVGVHGAGLATMVALPPQSTVIELRESDNNRHFQYLAALLGHAYYRLSPWELASTGDHVWETVREAIDSLWRRHPNLREPRTRAANASQHE